MATEGHSLVIAPQWIGDAVMTEPLLRRLQARGERLTVGALPWVAPVYRAMPQVAEVIEFPFQHGGLQLRERRRIAREVEGRFDAAYVLPNSLKSALLPFLASMVVGRGKRVYLVALAIRLGGVRAEAALRRYIEPIGWGALLLLAVAIGYVVIRAHAA